MSRDVQGREAIFAALKRVLHPLVRLAVRRGVLIMELFELLKVVYVQVAEEELMQGGGLVSASYAYASGTALLQAH